jgi:hypothetical protein
MLSRLAWPLAPSPNHLIPRWIVLRGLGLIYFSAFYSCAFQIQGLIGPNGILPVSGYLHELAQHFTGPELYWYAPTLLWFANGTRALTALWAVGMAASVLLFFNIWPRGMLAACFVAFLSFITAAQDFSSYQSDGMLLEAGFIAWFFAPPGFRPGLGAARPPSWLSYFLLQWEWFRIYFESGLVKILSGDPEWRHLTALDEYYQNGPLPTWIGWYVERLPHWFHAATAGGTLALELVVVWMMFLPRRWRIVLFSIVTPWEIGIILTANYAFLNYLVLLLGVLLLEDRLLAPIVEKLPGIRFGFTTGAPMKTIGVQKSHSSSAPTETAAAESWFARVRAPMRTAGMVAEGFLLGWIFYATTALLISILMPRNPPPMAPATLLEPFRIANRFGLFAVMTRGRYEIEFQGTRDGKMWIAYPFRYKPQDPRAAPGIYAPYQPRFDWNLCFASLEPWRANPWVLNVQEQLLRNDPAVLSLFAGNPFGGEPPAQVRTVLWQYWFSSAEEKHTQGVWWRRELRGLFSPTIEREPDGNFSVVQMPTTFSPAPE